MEYDKPPFAIPRYERCDIQHDRAAIEAAHQRKKGEQPACLLMADALVVYWQRQKERA